MKTRFILLALFIAISPVFGQTYNEHDVNKLIAFLKQPSWIAELTNAQALGIAGDLDTFDDWDTVYGLTWTDNESIRQLKEIEWRDSDGSEGSVWPFLGGHLDLSGCYALEKLKYEHTSKLIPLPDFVKSYLRDTIKFSKLCSVDVSGCPALISLEVNAHQLQSLNVSSCPSLTNLGCRGNLLRQLALPGCPSLSLLYCNDNLLTSLDLSGLAQLTQLECNSNQLISLDLSGLKRLIHLSCNSNRLTSLDLSKLKQLTHLSCNGNQLPSLNLSGLKQLTHLSCNSNQLTSLDLSGLNQLTHLSCDGNLLTSLNLSGLGQLTHLSCNSNQLPALNILPCPSLVFLSCSVNRMSFATLPIIAKKMKYMYAPQRPDWPTTVAPNSTISVLQRDWKITDADGKEYFTEYKWFNLITPLKEGIDYIDNGDGTFTLTGSRNVRNRPIYCLMTNPAFPAFAGYGRSHALRYDFMVDGRIGMEN